MKDSLIYILTNPSFPNYVKIGKTTDLQQRVRSLNNPTCLPFSFRVYATYKVETNLDTVEKAIHNLIDKIDYDLRAREEADSGRLREREFFALDAEKAFEVLREIAVLVSVSKEINIKEDGRACSSIDYIRAISSEALVSTKVPSAGGLINADYWDSWNNRMIPQPVGLMNMEIKDNAILIRGHDFMFSSCCDVSLSVDKWQVEKIGGNA